MLCEVQPLFLLVGDNYQLMSWVYQRIKSFFCSSWIEKNAGIPKKWV